MTVFEQLKNYNEEEMAEFLYRFSKDVINNFGNFMTPSKDGIINLLNREL